MSINRNNYEAFFLDYRENNLTPEQVAELMVFLEQNPDLFEEFESFEDIELLPELNVTLENKENLKKNECIPTDHIHSRNYDDFMVADLEGDLTEDDSIELKAFISLNPKTKLEYNFYRSTFLKPDKSIYFAGKDKLKKTGLFAIYRTEFIYALAVAASVILLMGVYFGFLNQSPKRNFADSIEKIDPLPSSSRPLIVNPGNDDQHLNGIEFRHATPSKQVEDKNPDQRDQLKSFKIAQLSTEQLFALKSIQTAVQPLNLQMRNLESVIIANASPSDNEISEKSFVSRFIGGLAGKVIKIDNRQRKSFFEYTLEGYNLMADKEVSIEKEVDENGKVIAYSLNGESISLSRNKHPGKD